ncbi:CHAT domain-containing protein [Leptothoe sp. ISB3NOV94-8A]
MPLYPRFATLLLALTLPALFPGLSSRVMAQTIASEPLLQVEETLQTGDETLGDGRFYDVYEFTGQADQTVTILLESEAFDAYLILENEQGDRIATNDNISSKDPNAALVIELPVAGRYRIIANARQANTQGPYRLTVQPTPTDQPNPLLSAAEVTLLEAKDRLQAGDVHFNRSEFQDALALWEESLTLFRTDDVRTNFSQDSRQGESTSLGNLGSVYASSGEYERAIDFLQRSLKIEQEIGNRRGEANSLGNLGTVYYALGKYERAISFLQQSLDIAKNIGERDCEAFSLGNLGLVYNALGEYSRAIELFQQSLEIAKEIGYRRSEASSLGNLGLAYLSLGESSHAIDFLQQQLDILQEIGNRGGEANSLTTLGDAYYALGEYERAIDFHQQSFDIAREIEYHQGKSNSLSGLGNAYYALGEYERAIDFHQQRLDIARKIGNRRGESNSLHNLGIIFRNLDDLTTAEQYFQTSAQIQESFHSIELLDANRLSLLDSQQSTYHGWQVTLMELGRPEAALAVAERGRAQALAVSMTRSLNPETEAFEPSTPLNLESLQSIAVQQQATLVEYSVLPSGRILIWLIQPDGTIHSTESDAAADDSLVDITGQFATLGHNSRGGELPKTPLNNLIQDAQAALTRGGPSDSSPHLSRQQLDTQLQQLHEILIEPITQWLPTDDQKRVIFIPHQELFRVPFTALRDSEGQYLIQHHTILTAPSIQSLELARQHRNRIQSVNTTDALIVGNPHFPDTLTTAYGWQPLPGAEREARNVGTYLSQHLGNSPTVLLHDQATETQVKDQLHSARFIHLATHGNLVSVNEKVGLPGVQYSFLPGLLALAASDQDDGSLTADELRDLTRTNPLNAELVVLSACQTGQGRVTSDGVDGLSRTLLTAGVPTMLVSLWNASDHHTVSLMDEFYRQFLEEDQDKAQALRQAMLQMIERGDDNPQHWAAFTLVGEAE